MRAYRISRAIEARRDAAAPRVRCAPSGGGAYEHEMLRATLAVEAHQQTLAASEVPTYG
jgi:hypothetical protein